MHASTGTPGESREGRARERSIGLIGLPFVAVGGIIGSGWLFAPLLTTQVAGPAASLSW